MRRAEEEGEEEQERGRERERMRKKVWRKTYSLLQFFESLLQLFQFLFAGGVCRLVGVLAVLHLVDLLSDRGRESTKLTLQGGQLNTQTKQKEREI
jgi:hypothetical protein